MIGKINKSEIEVSKKHITKEQKSNMYEMKQNKIKTVIFSNSLII